MGVWGTGPFDSDDAADMVAKLVKYINKVNQGSSRPSRGKRRGLLVRDHYSSARAAAQVLLVSHGTDILGGPRLEPVVRALARMRMDREWLAGWDSPREIASALDEELRVVHARLAACRGCRKSIKKPERRELDALIAQARSVPVPKSVRPKRRPGRTTRAAVRKERREFDRVLAIDPARFRARQNAKADAGVGVRSPEDP